MAYEDAFTFDGIEPIEKRFLNRAEDATYLVVKDRSLRNNEPVKLRHPSAGAVLRPATRAVGIIQTILILVLVLTS